MTNQNLGDLTRKLFGNLEVNIIENPKNPDKVIFERVMKKFERQNLYFEYDLKSNTINQISQDNHKRERKIIYRNPNFSNYD